MERIRKIVIQGKEIMAIDYSGLKEQGMINLAIEAKHVAMETPQPKLIINSFKNTYITPGYVRHMERESNEIKPIIERNALVGLNTPKMMILKGFNLFMGTDFRAFASEKEAIEYLIDESIVGELNPIFNT